MRYAIAALIGAGLLSAQDTPHLNLHESEQIALRNNPGISAARFLAEASKEVPKQLQANFQPSVFGSVTSVGASDGSRIAAGGLNNPVLYSRFASGVGVGQMITDFGRTRNLVQSATSRAKAQEENSNTTRAQILLDVDRNYFAILRSEAVLKVAEQTVTERQLVADQAALLSRNGLKSTLDVSFANVNLASAKLLVADAQNQVKASTAEFANALGYPGQNQFVLADEPVPGPPPDTVTQLVAEAIHNRPELAGLRYEEEAAAKFVKAERDLWMPSIGLVANLGLVPSGVSAFQSRYGAVGMNINLPLFNGGLFTARRAEAELRHRGVQEDVKDRQNKIVRDVQVAYLNAMNEYERMGLTLKLLEQAQLALSLAQSRYDLGLSSIIELSQAQLNLTSAQIANTNARYDYQSQWSALQYQIGALR